MVPSVRFDDLTPGAGRSFALARCTAQLVATDLGSVVPVIREAQRAAEEGSWVAGWIAYEAAPAFDEAFPIRPPDSGVASRAPLVWLGVFAEREAVAPPGGAGDYSVAGWVPSVGPEEYDRSIGEIRDRIAAGDTYQVNFTFRLRSRFEGDPFAFYADLIRSQRGAHAAYVEAHGLTVASASPELFFTMDDGRLTTRPMKGTAPRGRWPGEDLARVNEMLASEKEQAENLMIVDLLRNDMGRISEFGTVRVTDLCRAERYETVWQMTSTITSRLRSGAGLAEVLHALFPCGSVTGAPKASTMGIIARLETARRGLYCGAIGWMAPGGRSAAFNVGIRTATLDRNTGEIEYGVGGGITWDSIAAREHSEAYDKARVLTERRPRFDLLETIRWDEDGYWGLEAHLDRLEGSAAYFGFLFDRDRVRAALEAVSGSLASPSRVRLTVDEGGTPTVEAAPLGTWDGPVRLEVDEEAVDSNDPMLYHKTTARSRYEERLRRHPGADDVVLINEAGHVTETTIANLLAEIDGRWYTPPLSSGLLPGVYRATLLGEGRVDERVLTPGDLAAADRLAVVNSVRLWREAVLAPGPGTG